ncbi:alpha/beta hydrolase [Clostridium algidicarnis]|uniref:alpha/beta hydrolase n=1 Tax=Clostridium algidicarnis TaxID=37659 RepID=UPI00162363E4|nr:alpha/beta hydrolase-fold protein [Clostridium algidicarnis]MBB6698584.1 acetylesterase [Clostridium algidicarnis]
MVLTGSVYSKSLDIDTWISVAFPDRKGSDKPHKVIYMLHGSSGNSTNWVQNTLLPLYSQDYNVVFIMPEVGNTWYRNIKDRGNYFTYIVDELPKIIKNIFNISTKREDVAIMGNSMGAYGAMKCALSRPDQYWLCGSFSTACVTVREYLDELREQKDKIENPNMRSVYGPNLICTDDDELFKLAKKASEQPINPQIYMTIGKNDFLYEPNQYFSEKMKTLPLDFSFETWEGSHDWNFWNQSLKSVLDKYYKQK